MSMNAYYCVEIILAVLALSYNSKNKKNIFYISFGLLLLLLCFHNGQSDTDYPHYLNFFSGKGFSMYGSLDNWKDYNLEWPYFIYCKVLRSVFGNSDFVYIFFTGLMCALPLLFFAKKRSENYALSVFLIFTILNTQTYLFLYAAHRQMVANTLMFLAFIIAESKYRRKYIYTCILLVLAFYAHSSSFFIVPLLILSYFYKWNINKNITIGLMLTTMVLGIVSNKIFGDLFNQIALLLDGFEHAQRAVYYSINDIYEARTETTFNILAPLNILSCCFLYLSNQEEKQSSSMIMLVIATCIYNLFSFIPLVDRSITTLLLFGVCGAIPSLINKKPYIIALWAILAMYLYLANKAYNSPDFRMLPFLFIWE